MTRHVSEKRRDEAKIRHIGKERISRAGFPMKIVQYRKQEDIDNDYLLTFSNISRTLEP